MADSSSGSYSGWCGSDLGYCRLLMVSCCKAPGVRCPCRQMTAVCDHKASCLCRPTALSFMNCSLSTAAGLRL